MNTYKLEKANELAKNIAALQLHLDKIRYFMPEKLCFYMGAEYGFREHIPPGSFEKYLYNANAALVKMKAQFKAL